ncbi:MAG: SDR family oxidoreductase [Runella zeae]
MNTINLSQNLEPGLTEEMPVTITYIRKTYVGSQKLRNKVALITGGDSGIGKAVAIHFAREGADIAILYHPIEEEDAQATSQLIEKENRQCLLISGDLMDHTTPAKAIDTVLEHFGKIDILVNNAAVQKPCDDFTKIPDQQWEDTFEVNVFAIFRLTREAIKHMKPGSSIINTASVVAYQGNGFLIDYSATKGAIISFTRSLSGSIIGKGIRVNAVAPGPILTPLVVSTFPDQNLEDFGKDTPMQRGGQPCEVAPAYVFLASEDSSYMTGQVLHPNGGSIINA